MKPYQTFLLLIVIAATAVAFWMTKDRVDPRIEKFVDCYVELAILYQQGDTSEPHYRSQRDSLLNHFEFTVESIQELKSEFNEDAVLTAEIWDKIEKKLKDAKADHDIIE